jgi:Zn-dependent protease with chaperone function
MADVSKALLERVLPEARLTAKDTRLAALLNRALSKYPNFAEPIKSVVEVGMKRRGEMKGLVGLTTYCCVTADRNSVRPATQKMTFYSELLDEISDDSAVGVIAHELAHAWLNEHLRPEQSKAREEEADALARRWGYGTYLDALAAETEPP